MHMELLRLPCARARGTAQDLSQLRVVSTDAIQKLVPHLRKRSTTDCEAGRDRGRRDVPAAASAAAPHGVERMRILIPDGVGPGEPLRPALNRLFSQSQTETKDKEYRTPC